jgi:hypothetical protein
VDLTREAAAEALAGIQKTADRSRRTLTGGAPYLMLMWGVVAVAGFLTGQWTSSAAVRNVTWGASILLAGAASALVRARQGERMRSAEGARIGWMFTSLVVLLAVWMAVDPPSSWAQGALIVVLGFMFAYVVLGLWIRVPALVATGVVLAALSLAGYFWLPAEFGLWMAATLGGFFIVGGALLLADGMRR